MVQLLSYRFIYQLVLPLGSLTHVSQVLNQEKNTVASDNSHSSAQHLSFKLPRAFAELHRGMQEERGFALKAQICTSLVTQLLFHEMELYKGSRIPQYHLRLAH